MPNKKENLDELVGVSYCLVKGRIVIVEDVCQVNWAGNPCASYGRCHTSKQTRREVYRLQEESKSESTLKPCCVLAQSEGYLMCHCGQKFD